MAESDLVLDMDWNISKAEAKARKLQREYNNVKKEIESKKIEISTTSESIEKTKNNIKKLKAELEEIKDANLTAIAQDNPEEQRETYALLKAKKAEIEEQNQLLKKQQDLYDKQELSLEKAKNKAADIGDEILLNGKKTNKFADAFKKSQKSADRFGKRLKSLIASALFFSVVTKAFTALREEFGKLINETGTKTASLIAQLNGNLAVIGRMLYESAKPAIEYLLNALVQMTNVLANGLAKMLGKSVNEMKKLTQATKKQSEEAKRATAGFDTIQTLGGSSNGSGGANFNALTSAIDNEVSYLMMILSGAALVLGVILAFTGTNIPLGLGLIALGAIGLAATFTAAWGSLTPKVQNTIAAIMDIGATLFLILGLILILTGVGIPLGIGLIFLGASLKYGAYALTPGKTFEEKTKTLWKNVKDITIEFIDWFSDNVLDGIFGEEFGDALGDLFIDISSFVDNVVKLFEGMAEGNDKKVGTALLNGVIDLVNTIFDIFNLILNAIHFVGSVILTLVGALFGKGSETWNYFRGNGYQWNIPRIPKLATGAVLPGGSPMLAWVNDQPKGQPYLEGSIDNIAAAFEKYLGGRDLGNKTFKVEAKGNMAQLIRLLALEITEEQNRVSVF